jgi:anti-sigma28 factor (negative regulator of flagellin synthesis)
MLDRLIWQKMKLGIWGAVIGAPAVCVVFAEFGLVPRQSELQIAELLALATIIFLSVFFATAAQFLAAERIMSSEELPAAYQPVMVPPAQWTERTPVRYIEALKTEFAEVEDRLDFFAELEGYHRLYCDREALGQGGQDVVNDRMALAIAIGSLRSSADCDRAQKALLTERLDRLYAGEIDPEIRRVEEKIDELRHDRETTPVDWKGTLHKIDSAIRSHERDIVELRSWNAGRTKAERKTVQEDRFEQAKGIEYDNEFIRLFKEHAKFKAAEKKLEMRRHEIEKIRQRVANGELTETDARYLIERLEQTLGRQDDIYV